MTEHITHFDDLTEDVMIRVNAACNDFESRWQHGDPWSIDTALEAADPSDREVLLRELLPVELEYLRESGEVPDLEGYRKRFPQVDADWFDHLRHEFAAKEPPARVGQYEICEEIARGGMGIIYRARHRELGREVALKMLRRHLAQPDWVRRFQREAEATAALDHPHIVPIYDIGEHDGCPYLAMKLYCGGSLAELVAASSQRGALSYGRSAALMADVAEAVGYAHRRGLLHRDLKPGNILLDATGAPSVTDFGLVKRLHEDDTRALTHTDVLLGTPAYMSPEQAAGKELTTSSDVYSLGAILYELLTGRRPFSETRHFELLRQIVDQTPLPCGRIVPDIPRDLETVCLKCLEKEPGRRYGNAEALAEDLRQFLAGEPVAARRLTLSERLARRARKHPALAALASALVLVVCAAFVLVLSQWRIANHANEQLRIGKTRIERSWRESETHYHVSQARAVQRYLDTGQLSLAAEALDELETHASRSRFSLRSFENDYLARRLDSAVRVYGDHDTHATCMAFGPDSTWLATGDAAGNVYLWDRQRQATTDRINVAADDTGEIRGLAFAPDGTLLAVASGSRLRLVRVDNGQFGGSKSDWPGDWTCVCFAAQGDILAAGDAAGTVTCWDHVGGRCVNQFYHEGSRVVAIDASPSGGQLAYGLMPARSAIASQARLPRREATIEVRGMAEGSAARTLQGHLWERRYHVHSVAFFAGGAKLATSGGDTVRIWDLRSDAPPVELRGYAEAVERMEVSERPGAVHLVTASSDGRLSIWDGKRLYHVANVGEHTSTVVDLAVSADGETIGTVSWDGTARTWRREEGSTSKRIPIPAASQGVSALGPVGKRWITAQWGLGFKAASGNAAPRLAQISVWNLLSREKHGSTMNLPAPVTALALSPTDNRIAIASRDALRVVTQAGEMQQLECDGLIESLCWSRQGRLLAAAGRDAKLHVWRARAETQWETLEIAAAQPACALVFANDYLAAAGADGKVRIWWLERLGEPPRMLTAAEPLRCVAASPDGQYLAAGGDGRQLRVWDSATGKLLHTSEEFESSIRAAGFSPDGLRVAGLSERQRVRLYDVATGRQVMEVTPSRGLLPASFLLRRSQVGWGLAFGPQPGQLQVLAFGGPISYP